MLVVAHGHRDRAGGVVHVHARGVAVPDVLHKGHHGFFFPVKVNFAEFVPLGHQAHIAQREHLGRHLPLRIDEIDEPLVCHRVVAHVRRRRGGGEGGFARVRRRRRDFSQAISARHLHLVGIEYLGHHVPFAPAGKEPAGGTLHAHVRHALERDTRVRPDDVVVRVQHLRVADVRVVDAVRVPELPLILCLVRGVRAERQPDGLVAHAVRPQAPLEGHPDRERVAVLALEEPPVRVGELQERAVLAAHQARARSVHGEEFADIEHRRLRDPALVAHVGGVAKLHASNHAVHAQLVDLVDEHGGRPPGPRGGVAGARGNCGSSAIQQRELNAKETLRS